MDDSLISLPSALEALKDEASIGDCTQVLVQDGEEGVSEGAGGEEDHGEHADEGCAGALKLDGNLQKVCFISAITFLRLSEVRLRARDW